MRLTEEQANQIRILQGALTGFENGKELSGPQQKQAGLLNESGIRDNYQTMAQCSSATKIPLRILKKAKRSGCPAFQHNKVLLGEFLNWYFNSDSAEDKVAEDDYDELKKKETYLIERHKRLVLDGRYAEKSEVETEIKSCVGMIFTEIERLFVTEFPAKTAGLSRVEAMKIAKQEVESLKIALRKKFGKKGK